MIHFNEMGLNKALIEQLHNMQFSNPTPIQEKAIPIALTGKDILGSAKTGTGKTAAFAIQERAKKSWCREEGWNNLDPGGGKASNRKKALDFVLPNLPKLEHVYNSLSDEQSRDLLVKLMAYRALGYKKVRLPLNTPHYWKQREETQENWAVADAMDTGFRDWQVFRTDLRKYGYPFILFLRGIQTQLLLEQYCCACEDGSALFIKAEPGDAVIDAGGCYGDTAFYFAHKVGPEGKVLSFEFLPDHLQIFNRNLALNPDYSSQIELIENPLWSESGVDLYVEGSGPGTRVRGHPEDPSASRVTTRSIDDVITEQALGLDLIKMDIEGAELEALKGAEKSIQTYRPKLAISVYHRLHDFWEIPQWIESLNLGYRFFLRHFTIHAEETVLFAITDH